MEEKNPIYAAPLAEIIELSTEGATILYSGGNQSEKFVIGSESYDDNDFS
jgi:hypothetical protein